jgi:RNA polymerase sigma-70 factor (ECF subfamily)
MLHNLKRVVADKPMETHSNNVKTKTWQAHRDALFRFVLLRVRDETAAEDIVQEVLLKAHARQGALREPSKLRAWLYQITRNEIIDYYRLRKPSEAISNELIQGDTREEDNRAQRELARCLEPLLDELSEPCRQALRLADFEGTKQREVASRLGLSLSGAKSRVQRARKMLKDVLLKCCRVELDRRGRVVDYEVGERCGDCSAPTKNVGERMAV